MRLCSRRPNCRRVTHSCSRCALDPGNAEGLSGAHEIPWQPGTHSSAVRGRAEAAKPRPGVGQAPGRTLAPAQPYLALELHKVLRHAAQGKDLTILSWEDKKPRAPSVGEQHRSC